MILKVTNVDISNNVSTSLADPATNGSTSITVKNTAGFQQNDFVVVENMAEEKAEISQITNVTSDTQLAVTALKFDHGTDTMVTFIKFNKIRIFRSTDGGSIYSVLATIDMQVDRSITNYDDTTAQPTYYYKTAFYNTFTSQASAFSVVLPGTGYAWYNLITIQDQVLDLIPDTDEQIVTRRQLTDWINEEYRRLVSLASKIDQGVFLKSNASSPPDLTNGTALYDLPTDFKSVKKLEIAVDSVNYYRAYPQHEGFGWPSQVYDPTAPIYIMVANQFELRPTPTGGKYRMWYYYIPAVLVNDNDSVDLALRPYIDALKYKALSRAKQKDKKYDEAQYWDQETLRVEEMMVNELTNRTSLDIPRWVDLSDSSFLDSDDNWLWEM